MKVLTQQVLAKLLTGSIDYGKIQDETRAQLATISDVKAAVASIDFVLVSSAKYDVDGRVVSLELQQLGLSREASEVVVGQFLKRRDQLRAALHSRSLRLTGLQHVDWRVDCTLDSSEAGPMSQTTVHLTLDMLRPAVGEEGVTEASQLKLAMTPDKFRVLFAELKAAKAVLDAVA